MTLGSGTRPHLDQGLLGVTVAAVDSTGHRGVRLQRWSTRAFAIESDGPVAAGIDGEALTLTPPVRFVIRPRALSVRIATGHPGPSPSTAVPEGLGAMVIELGRIAIGRDSALAEQLESREEKSDGQFRDREARDPHPR